MTDEVRGTSSLLRLVRCSCGGSLREVDAYAPGSAAAVQHLAACNSCGSRFEADRVLRAADDAARTFALVVLTPKAA